MTTVPWWPRVSSSAARSSAAVVGAHGAGAEPGGDLDQVDGQVVAVQAGGLVPACVGQLQAVGAVAELVAELAAVAEHLQPVDDLVAVVLRDDQGDRQALLGGGDQLGRAPSGRCRRRGTR